MVLGTAALDVNKDFKPITRLSCLLVLLIQLMTEHHYKQTLDINYFMFCRFVSGLIVQDVIDVWAQLPPRPSASKTKRSPDFEKWRGEAGLI